jgi:hypothetical protein
MSSTLSGHIQAQMHIKTDCAICRRIRGPHLYVMIRSQMLSLEVDTCCYPCWDSCRLFSFFLLEVADTRTGVVILV